MNFKRSNSFGGGESQIKDKEGPVDGAGEEEDEGPKLKALTKNLENFTNLLNEYVDKLPKDLDKKDVVIFAGPELCGQSTLIYALINGSNSLDKAQHKFMMEIKTMNDMGHTSTFKQKQKLVIEPKDKDLTQNLKIGHDRTEIKTLLTEVFPMKDNEDMYLVDSAIFKSTGSDLLDLINTVVIREIMLRAKSIKLVFPLTTTHVDEKDILTIRNSLDSITQLFKGPDFNTLLNCVQPIITKARPTDEGFDIEIKWSDIM